MQTILNYIQSVISATWDLLSYELVPGISCKTIFLFTACLSIVVYFVRMLVFED